MKNTKTEKIVIHTIVKTDLTYTLELEILVKIFTYGIDIFTKKSAVVFCVLHISLFSES